MPRNPHRPGSSAAQSFRADEIAALDEILRGMLRGAHPRDLTRIVGSEVVGRLARKTARMKASLERQRELGMHAIEGKAG